VWKTLAPAICIALILTVLVFASDAQGQIILGHVTGTVIDASTGLPLANATVKATLVLLLTGQQPPTSRAITTSAG